MRATESQSQPRYLLRIAFGSSVLLDTREDHCVFESGGEAAYVERLRATEEDIYKPGILFPLATLLMQINRLSGMHIFDLVLVSKSHGAAALKIEKSLMQLGFMENGQFAFRHKTYNRGHIDDVLDNLSKLRTDVYFGSDPDLVTSALARGIAAAHFTPDSVDEAALQATKAIKKTKSQKELLSLSQKAFQIFTDFDGVLGDWQSENYFQASLDRATHTVDRLITNGQVVSENRKAAIEQRAVVAYDRQEKKLENTPVAYGPFAPLIYALSHFVDVRPLTARSGSALHRAIKTMRNWGLDNLSLVSLPSYHAIDLAKGELMLPKRGKQQSRVPLLFIEDSNTHILAARALGVKATGHVRRPSKLATWRCHTNSLNRVFAFAKILRSKDLATSRAHLTSTNYEPV